MQQRIESLDGLRGIAALVVVFSHALLTQPFYWENIIVRKEDTNTIEWIMLYTPIRILWSADKAVILFFVLSGFVLSLPWLYGKGSNYGRFMISRLFRIYLPYLVSMLIAIVIASAVGGNSIPEASEWTNGYGWQNRITDNTLPSVFLMFGNAYSTWLNNPTWTLVWEMRVSLIFPLLAICIARFGLLGAFLSSAALLLAFLIGQALDSAYPNLSSFVGDPHKTFYYAGFFLFGALIARYRNILSSIGSSINGGASTLILIFSMAFWLIRWPQSAEMLKAIGAIGVIIAAISSGPFRNWLTGAIPQWFGRVSYSLYLIHVPIIMTMQNTLHAWLNNAQIAIAAIFTSLFIAELYYRAVERPSHKLGRYFTKGRPSFKQVEKSI